MKILTLLVTLFLSTGIAAAADKPVDPVDSKRLNDALLQHAFDGDLDAVKMLIEQGAEVEASGPKKRTTLTWAAMNGHEAIVAFLLDAGADINAMDSGGQTALTFAVRGSHVGTVRYLLENGADANARKTKSGTTALIVAAAVGNIEVVQLLLEHGADIGLAEKSGDTALDRARQFEHPEVAKLLESELLAKKSS